MSLTAAANWSRVRRCLGGLLLTLLASLAALAWYAFYVVTAAAVDYESAPEGTPMSQLGGTLVLATGGVAIVVTGAATAVARENKWRRLSHVLILFVVAGLGALIWACARLSG